MRLPDRHGTALPLFGAGLCVLGLALTWVLADLVPAVHVRDAVALGDFTHLDHPFVEAPAGLLLALLAPVLFVTWSVLLVLVALRRGLPRHALAVALVVVLAPLSAEMLKPLLAHSHDRVGSLHITAASWPSGHSTAITVLVWCAVLVAPPGRRRLVATLGIGLAGAVGLSLLILAWHMPSDVVGGYLLATLWAALALAALRAFERRGPTAGSERDGRPTDVGLGHVRRGRGAVGAGVPQ